MGMFDTVTFRCPKCGGENEEQTKSGPCLLNIVPLDRVDPAMVPGMGDGDRDRDRRMWCQHCNTPLTVVTINQPRYAVIEDHTYG